MNQVPRQKGRKATPAVLPSFVVALAQLPPQLAERLAPVLEQVGQAVERFFAGRADAPSPPASPPFWKNRTGGFATRRWNA